MKTFLTVLGVVWFIGGVTQLVISIKYPPALGFATLDFLVGFSLSAFAIALIKGEKR